MTLTPSDANGDTLSHLRPDRAFQSWWMSVLCGVVLVDVSSVWSSECGGPAPVNSIILPPLINVSARYKSLFYPGSNDTKP